MKIIVVGLELLLAGCSISHSLQMTLGDGHQVAQMAVSQNSPKPQSTHQAMQGVSDKCQLLWTAQDNHCLSTSWQCPGQSMREPVKIHKVRRCFQ